MALITADHVSELSTTTGTSAFSLTGASDAVSVRFSAKCSVGDTCFYCALDVDGAGTPTGGWEIGLGTYSSANTLTRTQVLSSSNSGSTVSFAAGTKHVFITMPAAQVAWVRERLTAARTYYVRSDGSDSNTGLVNSSGGAFLTVQKAIDVISSTLDLGGSEPTISVADGTYTSQIIMKPLVGGARLNIAGNVAAPSNVAISTAGTAVTNSVIGTVLNISGVSISTSSGHGLLATAGGKIEYGSMDFGAITAFQVAVSVGGLASAVSNYTISGSAAAHAYASSFGNVSIASKAITISGTPAFSSFFAGGDYLGVLAITSCTFSGSATGKRYLAEGNTIVRTISSATYLPGSVAGTTATGGQYL